MMDYEKSFMKYFEIMSKFNYWHQLMMPLLKKKN